MGGKGSRPPNIILNGHKDTRLNAAGLNPRVQCCSVSVSLSRPALPPRQGGVQLGS